MASYLCLSVFATISLFFGTFKLSKKRERFIYIEDLFCLAFLILIMGCRTSGPDWDVYKNIYDLDLFTKDIGFGWFVLACKNLGMTLSQIRLLIAFLGITLIYITAKKFLDRRFIKWFYLFYFICPYFIDGIQLRNFLAMALLVFATPFLLEDNIKGSIKFVLLVVAAGLMQKTCFIYILLVFIKKIDKTKFLKYVGITIIIVSIFIGLNKSAVASLGNLLMSLFSDILVGINPFLTISTNLGWIVLWSETALSIALLRMINKCISKSSLIDAKSKSMVEIIYLMNLATVAVLPLYVLSTNFFRIGRNLQVLNVIAFCIFLQNIKLKRIRIKKENKYIIILMIIIQMIYISYWTILNEYWDSIVITAFTNNWFFGGY